MLRHFKKTVLALTVAGAIHSAQAFSLLGPLNGTWQVQEIGYNTFNTDIGGPMNLGEEYRWNIRTVTYGFDSSFLNYFGQKGVDAVNQAFAILNALPAFSKMSTNLAEFATDTRRINYRASALSLLDLKSTALGAMMEELGLASPDRYAWTLRGRFVNNNIPYYLVIKRNFDPVTLAPSSYVNGVLYTYGILEIAAPPAWDAVEVQVDPLAFGFTAVASDIDNIGTTSSGSGALGPSLGVGEFYAGLTRDDVGGLRYIYRPNNYNVEDLIPGTTGTGFGGGSSGGSPWSPAGGGGGTNILITNSVVGVALRPGVDHITFQQAKYDSVFGFFVTLTNTYQDKYVTNSSLITQTTRRVLTQPDILITAGDLGLTANFPFPVLFRRTIAAPTSWVNNNGINSQSTTALDGPGAINGQIELQFSKLGPYILNVGPFPDGTAFLDEFNNFSPGLLWGSFDGTTNEPVVYPIGTSIQDLERRALGGR